MQFFTLNELIVNVIYPIFNFLCSVKITIASNEYVY